MIDRRLLRSNGRVAHISQQGSVEADSFVESERHRVAAILTALCDAPHGNRDRELLRGDLFHVLEVRDGWCFGFAERDGYVGYVEGTAFVPPSATEPTHRVSVARTYGKATADLKTTDTHVPIPFGARVAVIDDVSGWSRVAWSRGTLPGDVYIPSQHLVPLDQPETDPVAVARRFLGTPYLWGGNSSFGIDCSGLVQAAMLACDWACPGDSDLQELMPGTPLAPETALEPGDLIFWRGHVAMASGPDTMIHANAHHMLVVEEPTSAALARIAETETGPVTTRLRPEKRPVSSSV